jgi:hypothetical protein
VATLKIEHPHGLSDGDAKARAMALGDYLQSKHGLTVSWEGGRARISGRYLVVTIEGTVDVRPGVVVFEGKDPGLMWRNKARTYLERKLATYLDPGTPLESLPRH